MQPNNSEQFLKNLRSIVSRPTTSSTVRPVRRVESEPVTLVAGKGFFVDLNRFFGQQSEFTTSEVKEDMAANANAENNANRTLKEMMASVVNRQPF